MQFRIWSTVYVTVQNQLSMSAHPINGTVDVQPLIISQAASDILQTAGLTGVFPIQQRSMLLATIHTLLSAEGHVFDPRCWRVMQWLDAEEAYRLHCFHNRFGNPRARVYRWQIRTHDPDVLRFAHLPLVCTNNRTEKFRTRQAAVAWAQSNAS